jgi:mannose-6-phosphate isomerase
MPYAWGSRTAIASLTGRDESDGPEAELWMGAHPLAPSKSVGRFSTLDQLIASDPERELGARALNAFGPRLPFLLKVLAAEQPLSLQAHPTMAQAEAGFDDEERRRIPLTAPNRNYKDRSHKPELLCALTTFHALSGFRDYAKTLQLFDQLAVKELDPFISPSLRETFGALINAPKGVVPHVLAACAKQSPHFANERALALRLQELYPGDIGIVIALLLEYVILQPGEAIFLDAGNLHAYLQGTGVEIMASSDNVLRGGLTPKHVDVPELTKTLDFEAVPPRILHAQELDACESAYVTSAKEFRLSRIDVSTALVRETFGPEILLVTEGAVHIGEIEARRGYSVFIPSSKGRNTLVGDGVVYPATTKIGP